MKDTTYRATNEYPSVAVTREQTSHHSVSGGTNETKEQASQAAATVEQEAKQTQEELKRQAADMAEAGKQQARETAERARQSGAQYAHEKKVRVAEEIGVFSGAIRKASHKLHEEQHDSIANYVDAAAEQLDQCREALESKQIGEIFDDLQDFARRRPEVVYGGLFVTGLAAMRFLKASKSSRVRHEDRDLSQHNQRPASTFGHAPERQSTLRSGSSQSAGDGYSQARTTDEFGGGGS